MSIELDQLVDPGHTALVLVEMQEGVLGDDSFLPDLARSAREAGVIEATAAMCRAARAAGVPVVHATAEDLDGRFGANHNARLFLGAVKHGARNAAGGPTVQPLAELVDDGDLVVPRRHGLSPLTGSELDSLLRNEGITTIVVAGVSLNVAVTNVVFDAINRSYQVVVVRDAVVGVPAEYGEQVLQNSLAYLATIVGSDDLAVAWDARATGGAG